MADKQTILPTICNEYHWGLAAFQENLAQLKAKIDNRTATAEEIEKYEHIQSSITLIKENANSKTGSAVYAMGILYKTTSNDESRFGGVYKLHSSVLYSDPADVDDTITTAGISVPCTMTSKIRENYAADYVPLDGDLCVIEFPKSSIEQSRPNSYVTYVYNRTNTTGGWRQVNVSAEHIWFDKGIRRNAAWGNQPESDELIVGECAGMNLIQLLEYFLVGYTPGDYPSLSADWGNITWNPLTISFNPTINHELNSMPTLVSAGKLLHFDQISAPTKYTVSNQTTTLGPAKVTGMLYGYWDGSAKQDATSITGQTTQVVTQYDNDTTNEAKLEIQVVNFDPNHVPTPATVVSSDSSTDVVIPAFDMIPQEGTATIEVSLTNNYSIQTREITGTIPHITNYEYFNSKNKHDQNISDGLSTNQDVVISDKEVTRPSQAFTDQKSTTVIKTFSAVYPIYTNGKCVPPSDEHGDGQNWPNVGDYTGWAILPSDEHGGIPGSAAAQVECSKLIDYNSSSAEPSIRRIQIGFPSTSRAMVSQNITCRIYTPANRIFNISTKIWNNMFKTWDDDSSLNWVQDGTVMIDGIMYDNWKLDGANLTAKVFQFICS